MSEALDLLFFQQLVKGVKMIELYTFHCHLFSIDHAIHNHKTLLIILCNNTLIATLNKYIILRILFDLTNFKKLYGFRGKFKNGQIKINTSQLHTKW